MPYLPVRRVSPAAFRSITNEPQRRALMQSDVISLVASDLILWLAGGGMMNVAFIIDIGRMDLDNDTAHAACLRVPAHMVSDLESLRHGFSSGIHFPAWQNAGTARWFISPGRQKSRATETGDAILALAIEQPSQPVLPCWILAEHV